MNTPAVITQESCISEKQIDSNKMVQSWKVFDRQLQLKYNFSTFIKMIKHNHENV